MQDGPVEMGTAGEFGAYTGEVECAFSIPPEERPSVPFLPQSGNMQHRSNGKSIYIQLMRMQQVKLCVLL